MGGALQTAVIESNRRTKLYGPFLWTGVKCPKATEPLRGDSFLLTTKSPGVLETRFIDLGRMKDSVDLSVIQFTDPWIGNPET